jgi:hypothetical protein
VPAFLKRPRVLVLAGLAALAVVGIAVALVRSQTPGCTVPPPEIALPDQLRTLGELAQPFETADTRTLQDASVRAATALHSDLAGASADAVVRVAADKPATHDALVVPLSETAATPEAPRRVVGLVAFLLDCGGRAYYDDVDDLLRTDPSLLPGRFPTVTAEQAAAALDVRSPRLVYRDTPFHPLWLDPAGGRSVAAGPPV